MEEEAVHRFGDFRLDPADASLWRGPARLHLSPKALSVLVCLARRRGALVTKAQLLDSVWPETAVSEAVLTTAVREIRQVLGDRARAPRYVETVHGRGYRFVPSKSEVYRRGTLVGRDAERAGLAAGYERAAHGARCTLLVEGAAGIGKTTLVDEVERIAAGARIGRGQCVEQHGAGEPYLPLLEALSRLGRRDRGVVDVLARHASSWLGHLPALTGQDPVPPRPASPARMLREIAEALEVLAADRALVLVLEDLHWSDAATLHWLDYATRRKDPARLLVVGTFRPPEDSGPLRALVGELAHQAQACLLRLGPFGQKEMSELLAARYGRIVSAGGLEPLASAVHRRTGGHPLFAVTMLEAIEKGGLLRPGAEGWAVEAPLSAIETLVPDTVRAHINGQVARLQEPERAVLEAAAVAGPRPAIAAIAAGLDMDVDEVEPAVSTLIEREELLEDDGLETWPDGTTTLQLRFRHDIFQEVVYARMPAARRVRLHRAIGHRLAAAFAAAPAARAAELAAHFEAAGDWASAARFLALAARTARLRAAFGEASRHVALGRACVKRLPHGPLRDSADLALELERGVIAMVTAGWAAPEVGDAYRRAQVLTEKVREPELEMRALFGALGFALVRGQHKEHRRLSAAMRRAAERHQDASSALVADVELAGAAFGAGDLDEADRLFSRAHDAYDRSRHEDHVARFGADFGVFGAVWRAHLSWHRGLQKRAERELAFGLALARDLDHPTTRTIAYAYAAWLFQFRGEPEEARIHAEVARRLASEHGAHYYLCWSEVVIGWADAVEGRRDGLGRVRESLEALERSGARRLLSYFWTLYAERSARLGRTDEANEGIAQAFLAYRSSPEPAWRPELLRIRGRLLAQRNPIRARQRLAAAVEAAERMGAPPLLERARHELTALGDAPLG